MAQAKSKIKKRKAPVKDAIAHIQSTFNNTLVTITDRSGNTIAWASAGSSGFTNARKSTPHAAKMAAEKAIAEAAKRGVENLSILISGPGAGRESAARGLVRDNITIVEVADVTKVPHNGVRPENERSG